MKKNMLILKSSYLTLVWLSHTCLVLQARAKESLNTPQQSCRHPNGPELQLDRIPPRRCMSGTPGPQACRYEVWLFLEAHNCCLLTTAAQGSYWLYNDMYRIHVAHNADTKIHALPVAIHKLISGMHLQHCKHASFILYFVVWSAKTSVKLRNSCQLSQTISLHQLGNLFIQNPKKFSNHQTEIRGKPSAFTLPRA